MNTRKKIIIASVILLQMNAIHINAKATEVIIGATKPIRSTKPIRQPTPIILPPEPIEVTPEPVPVEVPVEPIEIPYSNWIPVLKLKNEHIKLNTNSGVFNKNRALDQLKEAWDNEDGGGIHNPLALKNKVKVKMINPDGVQINKIDPKISSPGIYTVIFELPDSDKQVSAVAYLSVEITTRKR